MEVAALDGRVVRDRSEWMSALIKVPPKLSDRHPGARVHQVRRKIGEWPQHVGAHQKIRPRQSKVGPPAYEVSVEQYVEIHGPGRPTRRLARPATERFNRAQDDEQFIDAELGGKCGHEIDEVRPFEARGPILVPGREAHIGKGSRELASGQRHVLMGRNIAAGGDEDLRHG
jgi:hypothetical protein